MKPNTDYQLHIIHLKIRGHDTSNMVDFTERRLLHLARRTNSSRVRKQVMDVLESYRDGSIAVAWSMGQPLYYRIDRRGLESFSEEA
jgi:hypothetical protein